MASYPSKPWSDGQEHDIYPNQTFIYSTATGRWTRKIEVPSTTELSAVDSKVTDNDSDIAAIKPGLDYLETWSPTAVSSKIFTWDESKYAGVRLVLCGIACASPEGSPLRGYVGHSNGTVFAGSQYEYANVYDTNGGASTNLNETWSIWLSSIFGYNSGSDNGINGTIDVMTPQTNDAGFADFGLISNLICSNFSTMYNTKSHAMIGPYAGMSTTTNTYDSFKLEVSGTTFASGVGEVYVYGYRR